MACWHAAAIIEALHRIDLRVLAWPPCRLGADTGAAGLFERVQWEAAWALCAAFASALVLITAVPDGVPSLPPTFETPGKRAALSQAGMTVFVPKWAHALTC